MKTTIYGQLVNGQFSYDDRDGEFEPKAGDVVNIDDRFWVLEWNHSSDRLRGRDVTDEVAEKIAAGAVDALRAEFPDIPVVPTEHVNGHTANDATKARAYVEAQNRHIWRGYSHVRAQRLAQLQAVSDEDAYAETIDSFLMGTR